MDNMWITCGLIGLFVRVIFPALPCSTNRRFIIYHWSQSLVSITFQQRGRKTLPHEVACITVNPVVNPGSVAGVAGVAGVGGDSMDVVGQPSLLRAQLVAVGLWTDMSLRGTY